MVGEALRLTPAAYSQTGRVWTNGKLNVAGGFTTDFVFRFTQQGGIGAADGIAFVIQDISGTAVGGFGGGIGYHGLERSLAVEFDTYDNGSGNGDPDNNHVAVHSAGTGVNTTTLDTRLGVALLGTAVQLSDGNVHRARIVYAATGLLTVYLDDMRRRSCRSPSTSTRCSASSGATPGSASRRRRVPASRTMTC